MKAVLHRSPSTGLPITARPPRLWTRFVEWAGRLGHRQDMSLAWSCCGTPMLDPMQEDMGRADSFSLTMYRCSHCGARWLGACSLAPMMTRRWQFVPSGEGGEAGASSGAGSDTQRMPHTDA